PSNLCRRLETRHEGQGIRSRAPLPDPPRANRLSPAGPPEGEIATARGAGAAGATMVAGMLATTPIEGIAKAATGPLWFQTYILKDRGFTRDLVQRAEGVGCKALCITSDSPVVGVRNRDARANFSLPANLERANLRGLMRTGGNLRPPE